MGQGQAPRPFAVAGCPDVQGVDGFTRLGANLAPSKVLVRCPVLPRWRRTRRRRGPHHKHARGRTKPSGFRAGTSTGSEQQLPPHTHTSCPSPSTSITLRPPHHLKASITALKPPLQYPPSRPPTAPNHPTTIHPSTHTHPTPPTPTPTPANTPQHPHPHTYTPQEHTPPHTPKKPTHP